MLDLKTNVIKDLISSQPKSNPLIVVITGKAGSGKDTFCEMVMDRLHTRYSKVCRQLTHADALKKLLIHSFGFTAYQVYTQEGKAEFNEEWNMTNREALIKIGTESLRNNFHPDVWIKLLTKEIQNTTDVDFIFITDCRFDNELNNLDNLHPEYDVSYIDIIRSTYVESTLYDLLRIFFKYNQWLYNILHKLRLVSFRYHISELLKPREHAVKVYNIGTLGMLKSSAAVIAHDLIKRLNKEYE